MASRLAVIALVVAVAGLVIFKGILPSFRGPMLGKTLNRYPTETAFWFAWAAFYPDTQISSR